MRGIINQHGARWKSCSTRFHLDSKTSNSYADRNPLSCPPEKIDSCFWKQANDFPGATEATAASTESNYPSMTIWKQFHSLLHCICIRLVWKRRCDGVLLEGCTGSMKISPLCAMLLISYFEDSACLFGNSSLLLRMDQNRNQNTCPWNCQLAADLRANLTLCSTNALQRYDNSLLTLLCDTLDSEESKTKSPEMMPARSKAWRCSSDYKEPSIQDPRLW